MYLDLMYGLMAHYFQETGSDIKLSLHWNSSVDLFTDHSWHSEIYVVEMKTLSKHYTVDQGENAYNRILY